MVMRGLAMLSKAVLETQAGQLRQVLLGSEAVTVARSFQATAEEQFSAAMGKMQVRRMLCCPKSHTCCWHYSCFFPT